MSDKSALDLVGQSAVAELDRYGGWTGLAFGATGFFRLERTDRWWLVTPEGHAYLSFGLNHAEPSVLTAPHNRAFWADQFCLASESAAADEAFLPGFVGKVLADARAVGFNALGCHTDPDLFPPRQIPYVKTVRFLDICHYMEPGPEAFVDVFSPQFGEHSDQVARRYVTAVADDAYLLGYFFTDCPVFTELDAAPRIANIYGQVRKGLPTFPRVLRNLPGWAPGKAAYVELMRQRYGLIEDFNASYSTNFASFEALQDEPNWRPGVDVSNQAEASDNEAFLLAIIDQMYAVEVGAIRRYDSRHLIFGDKLNGNVATSRQLVALADKHFDLVFYQMYGRVEEQSALLDSWAGVVTKPLLLGDSSINLPSADLPDPYGPHCGSPVEQAEAVRAIYRYLFARPDIVGWHWCGWMDQWRDVQPGKQHAGFQDALGRPHPVAATLRELAQTMYHLAVGLTP